MAFDERHSEERRRVFADAQASVLDVLKSKADEPTEPVPATNYETYYNGDFVEAFTTLCEAKQAVMASPIHSNETVIIRECRPIYRVKVRPVVLEEIVYA